MTPDASILSDASSLNGTEQVYMGNGQGLLINSVGSMPFPSLTQSNSTLILNKLLLVPHITKNLLSINKFAQDNRVFFEFHPQFCSVKLQNSFEILLHGTVGVNGLYRFANPTLSKLLTNRNSNCNKPSSFCLSTVPIANSIEHCNVYPCNTSSNMNKSVLDATKPNFVSIPNATVNILFLSSSFEVDFFSFLNEV